MKAQEITRQVRLRQWADGISECQASGQTVKNWCKEHQLTKSTYYYRLKRVREAVIADMTARQELPAKQITEIKTLTFTEICPGRYQKSIAAVVLHIGTNILEVNNGAKQETIENALAALKNIC